MILINGKTTCLSIKKRSGMVQGKTHRNTKHLTSSMPDNLLEETIV